MEHAPEPRGAEGSENHRFTLEETNAMQMELMEQSHLDPEMWIEVYSAAFRELIENDPALHERYIADSKGVLAEIRATLEKRTLH